MSTTPLSITANAPNGFNYGLSPTNGGDTIYGSSTSGTTSVPNVPVGSYNLVLTDPTTNAVISNSTVDTTTNSSIYVSAVSPTDDDSDGYSSTPVVSGQANSQTNSTPIGIIQAPSTTETFTAPNGEYGKYFTCQDARIYIGSSFIDESIYVQFTLQDNKIPLYGYRSRYFDATSQGKSIVQGQLGLNFVSEGYLYTALNDYMNRQNSTPNDDQTTLNNLAYTKAQLQIQQASTPTSYVQSQLTAINIQLAAMAANPNVSLATAQTFANSSNATSSAPTYPNAVYTDIVFDIVLQLEGAQRTVKRMLEGCQLIANDQVIDSSGNTLSDGYSFIARRLR